MRVCLGSTLIQGYGLTEVTACATLMAMDDLGTEVCGIPNQVRIIISYLFLHVSKPQYFFPIWILIVIIYQIWETSRNTLKKYSVTKNCSVCLNILVCTFSAFSLEFQKFFSITTTIFSHSRQEKFW